MTEREKLFCKFYSVFRNPRESAAAAGYTFASSKAVKLLERADIRKEIRKLELKNQTSFSEVVSGLRRLAFGSSADAVKLIFREEITDDEIEHLDLFNVSDIKRPKSGGVEIKFFDRQKALEKLLQISELDDTSGASSFLTALEKGAGALGGVAFNEEKD